jgi:hypothetical protein
MQGGIELTSTQTPLSAGKTRRGSGNKRGVMDLLASPKPSSGRKPADYFVAMNTSNETVDSEHMSNNFITPDVFDIPYNGRHRPSLRSFSGGDALLAIGEEGSEMDRVAGDLPFSHRMKPQPSAQMSNAMGRYSVGSDSPDMPDGVMVSSLSIDTRLPITDRQHQLQQQSPPPRRNSRGANNNRFKAFNQRVFGTAISRAPLPAQQQRTRVSSLDASILDMYHDEVQEYYSHNHEVEEDDHE